MRLDDESSVESTDTGPPPLVSRQVSDDSSDDSTASYRRGFRPKWDSDDSDDDDSVWTVADSNNSESGLIFDLDELFEELLDHETGRETANPTVETAALKMEGKSINIGPHTYLADSGASSHMGPGDAGMYDLTDKKTTVKIGDGKQIPVAKVGKRKGTVTQPDGSEVQVTLKQYKQVPDLWVNLFSLTAAMSDGWSLGNSKKAITLTKDGVTITFDKIFPSGDGYVCGTNIVPVEETAAVATLLAEGTTVDINEFHLILNHAGEETLQLTAKNHGIKLKGKLIPCFACKMANAKKPSIPKSTETVASKIGERIFIDTSSIKSKSFGGTKFWLLVVDDKSSQTWSYFLKQKSDQVNVMLTFLRQMSKSKTPVKFIRADNAGENLTLEKKIDDDPHLTAKLEKTPRNSPQYNGKVERMFQTLWNGTKANLNGAKLPANLRTGLWAEAARYTQLVHNQLVTYNKKDAGCPHQQFHNQQWKAFPYLKPFGSIAIVPTSKGIQAKGSDKGIPMLYLGPADNHGKDVGRFLNLDTKKVVIARPSVWMNQMYGDWKGLRNPQQEE